MNPSYYRISLDVHDATSQLSFPIKKGDTRRRLLISLMDDGVPYTITKGCYAVFSAKKIDGTIIFNDCTIKDNMIIYDISEQTSLVEGRLDCEITLFDSYSEQITSPRFTIVVYATTYTESDVESSDEYKSLLTLVSETTGLINDVTNKLENGDFIGEKGDKGDTGDTGAKIVSQILQGQDENGGNIYEQTFDDGTVTYFTAPKGESGEASSAIKVFKHGTVFKYDVFKKGDIVVCDDENGKKQFYIATTNGVTSLSYPWKNEADWDIYKPQTAETADVAVVAMQDEFGDSISEAYAKKSDLSDGSFVVASADSALVAHQATNDGDGNHIAETYAAKEQIESGEVLPPKATTSSLGVIAGNNNSAFLMSSGKPICRPLTPADYSLIDEKAFISKATLETIKNNYVKEGITANTKTLTDQEKADACEWLGAVSKWLPSTGGFTNVLTQSDKGIYSPMAISYYPSQYKLPAYNTGGTLSVNTPTADNHSANKKYVDDMVNKPYELIEEFTLTEASNFVRTQEPDGTVYNFKEVAIDINYGEKVAATNRIVINLRNFEESVSNAVKYSVYRLWIKNGVFNLSSTNGAYRGLGTAVNSFSDITLANEYITSINLSRENGYPVGTIFKIYGVRA